MSRTWRARVASSPVETPARFARALAALATTPVTLSLARLEHASPDRRRGVVHGAGAAISGEERWTTIAAEEAAAIVIARWTPEAYARATFGATLLAGFGERYVARHGGPSLEATVDVDRPDSVEAPRGTTVEAAHAWAQVRDRDARARLATALAGEGDLAPALVVIHDDVNRDELRDASAVAVPWGELSRLLAGVAPERARDAIEAASMGDAEERDAEARAAEIDAALAAGGPREIVRLRWRPETVPRVASRVMRTEGALVWSRGAASLEETLRAAESLLRG